MPDVTILPDGVLVPAGEGENLLAAVTRAGLRYRFGCRRGGCGICKLTLVLGEVRYERPIAATVLTDEERVDGICLSCRAVPITDVIVELQEGDRLQRVVPYDFASRNSAKPAEGDSKGRADERHAPRVRAHHGDRPRGSP